MAPRLSQMRRDELRVEQAIAAAIQPRHQMDQADFRRVGDAMEHALAKKGPAHRQPVKTAHQLAIAPGLDRMGEAEGEKLAEQVGDAPIDPGLFAPRPALGAAGEDAVEIRVRRDLERRGAKGFGEAFRDDQPVERKNAAFMRVEPVQMLVALVLPHGKQADRIGAQAECAA